MFLFLEPYYLLTHRTLTPNGSQAKQVWTSLFDGNTLRGWHTIPGGNWEVINGTILGTSSKGENRHGLLVSDKI